MWEELNDRADSLRDLSRTEHLLVWAMRTIAIGHEECPIVVNTFQQVCGSEGAQVLQAYCVFVKYVAMSSRTRLQVHVPGCPCVGPDEAAMVAIIAAAQRAVSDRDETSLKACVRRMTGYEPDPYILSVAQSLGQFLAASGLKLPARPMAPGERLTAATAAPPRVLH